VPTDTVWDFDESLPTPAHDPVSGKVEPSGGGGPAATAGAAAGGGITVAGLNLSVIGDLAVSLGKLTRAIERQQAALRLRDEATPGDYQYATSGLYPASGLLALNLGSPDQGQYWLIRRIIIGGSDITTAPNGIGWIYVQGQAPNANGANPSVANAADMTTGTLPQRAFYGTHQLVVDETEYLWVIVTGGTVGVQYVANVKAEVYNRASMRGAYAE
jgi:hypothetical protein